MPIYTKKGDRGETGLPGKRKRLKSDILFDFLGTLDQTSATIGLALATKDIEKDIAKELESVQSELLSIGACIASEKPDKNPFLKILLKRVSTYEKLIDKWEEEMGSLTNFILVGGSKPGATLHLSRTIARQAERLFHKIKEDKPGEIAVYLNRLSDFLFQVARYINYKLNSIEKNWINPQK